ncbi:peptidase inhibitor family I36 protein [Streptomyces sp. MBT27]|uniref:peptidase inhibitor family I36 protein n=1 Tax=Streptomyces sp. MBT27 TaxID=1488356 RepID=UPI0019647371|nr:peptidase inhibitor family I36 protein [Streptomyces sp. MBT27]
MSDKEPQLIYGRGAEACPEGSFCLYRAVSLNGGTNDKILAIPLGVYVNDFSVYGFDHSGDGVSSVVNNTDEDNALFSAAGQQGHSLPVGARSSITDLRRIGMAGSPNGTWNDQAQSAQSAPFTGNLRVDQELRGQWAEGGGRIYSYRLTVHAEDTRVVKWAVGFGDLPEGTSLPKTFTDVFWGEVLRDGSEGSVLLGSPEGGGHSVDPGTDLLIDIQVLYPNHDPAHEHLTGLQAQQLD